jgi:hypothetical protein
MKLDEFNKPDYKNMSEEELTKLLAESLNRLEKIIDTSNERIENGSTNTKNIRKISKIQS